MVVLEGGMEVERGTLDWREGWLFWREGSFIVEGCFGSREGGREGGKLYCRRLLWQQGGRDDCFGEREA